MVSTNRQTQITVRDSSGPAPSSCPTCILSASRECMGLRGALLDKRNAVLDRMRALDSLPSRFDQAAAPSLFHLAFRKDFLSKEVPELAFALRNLIGSRHTPEHETYAAVRLVEELESIVYDETLVSSTQCMELIQKARYLVSMFQTCPEVLDNGASGELIYLISNLRSLIKDRYIAGELAIEAIDVITELEKDPNNDESDIPDKELYAYARALLTRITGASIADRLPFLGLDTPEGHIDALAFHFHDLIKFMSILPEGTDYYRARRHHNSFFLLIDSGIFDTKSTGPFLEQAYSLGLELRLAAANNALDTPLRSNGLSLSELNDFLPEAANFLDLPFLFERFRSLPNNPSKMFLEFVELSNDSGFQLTDLQRRLLRDVKDFAQGLHDFSSELIGIHRHAFGFSAPLSSVMSALHLPTDVGMLSHNLEEQQHRLLQLSLSLGALGDMIAEPLSLISVRGILTPLATHEVDVDFNKIGSSLDEQRKHADELDHSLDVVLGAIEREYTPQKQRMVEWTERISGFLFGNEGSDLVEKVKEL